MKWTMAFHWLLQPDSFTVLSPVPQAVNSKCFPLAFSSCFAVTADTIKKTKMDEAVLLFIVL